MTFISLDSITWFPCSSVLVTVCSEVSAMTVTPTVVCQAEVTSPEIGAIDASGAGSGVTCTILRVVSP